jgi:hypothetical protein
MITLRSGDRVPHFDVTRHDGSRVRYATEIWQSRNLLLLSIPDRARAEFAGYLETLTRRLADISGQETTSVVTSEAVPGVPHPGLLIADRWGEIFLVVDATAAADLPDVDDLVEWLGYVQRQCPECQGETK